MITWSEFKADWYKLPNLLTIIRLIFSPIPGAMILFYTHDTTLRTIAAAVFALVVITDVLDGYLARRLDMVTDLGKLLDPIVDKVLVIVTLLAISIVNPFIMTPMLIIVLRETSVTLMRTKAKERGFTIASAPSGKFKMVMQSIMAIVLLLPLGDDWFLFTTNTVVATVIVTLLSWYDYHVKFSDGEKSL